MSGICGIVLHDGRTPQAEILHRMLSATPHRGPDGTHVFTGEGIGLGHQLLVAVPEAAGEHQPLRNPETACSIVFDGRLDNRDELLTVLGKLPFYTYPVTDAELVLRLYEKKREACLGLLMGDFAFAIWDRRGKRLFCARDIFGICPFYYYGNNRAFIFTSSLRQLLEHPDVPRETDTGMAGEYLAGTVISKTGTLYKNIHRLPPAHYLIVENGNIAVKRYFLLEPQEKLRYRNDGQYAEHFLEVFGRAVSDRLRCSGTVGVYLSGGLDSSTILGMSEVLARRGSSKNTEAFSLVFPNYSDCDESVYIKCVEERWQLHSHKTAIANYVQSDLREEARYSLELPVQPNLAMDAPMMQAAADRGVKAMLSGIGGDALFFGSRYLYRDLLRALQLSSLCSVFRRNLKARGWMSELKGMAADLSWPLVPRDLRSKLLLRKNHPVLPPWLSAEFVRAVAYEERWRQADVGEQFAQLADAELYYWAASGAETDALELNNRYSAAWGIEERYPFLDIRLVQFALALPEQQRLGVQGETRHVLREAGRVLLPDKVRVRGDKAEFSRLCVEALRSPAAQARMNFNYLGALQWVSVSELTGHYRHVLATCQEKKPQEYRHLYVLWTAVALDAWLEVLNDMKTG